MLTFVVITVVILIMLGMEWKDISPKKNKRNFWVFSSLLSVGILLWVLRGINIDIGNPISMMESLNPFYTRF